MNYKSIIFFLGISILFVSLFAFLNILYSIYFNFFLDLNSYIATLSVSLFFGIIFYYVGKNSYKNISITDQIIFILLAFITIPALISIPYFLSIYNINFLNAYFESISGFTTTGFSILNNLNNIDEPLILWRSSSQWLGGLFFLIITIGTISSKQIKIKPSYLISGIFSDKNFYNNFNYNFLRIFIIYFFSTIFVIFLYYLFDIRLLDAVNLAFTSISSGGFLSTDKLSNILINDAQIFVFTITLLFSIFNFYLFFNIIANKLKFTNHEEDLHLLILLVMITLFFYFFVAHDQSVVRVFLAVASSISTSGISIYSSKYDLSLFFIVLTIIGGALISVSSGFKYVRFYILLKISYQEIYRLVKPINIFNKNLFNSESKIDNNDSKIAFLVFISFIGSLFVLSSILTLDNVSFEDAFKLAILTLTNTVNSSLYGLESFIFFDLKSFTKISLIFFMILGKIEIIAILFLVKKFIFRG